MKQNADKKDRNRTCRHINYVWSVVVCVLMAVSVTAQGKSVDPQRAAEIARRYVTLSHHDVSKVRRESLMASPPLLIIYITTRKAVALLSLLATTRWARCWPTAPRVRLTR